MSAATVSQNLARRKGTAIQFLLATAAVKLLQGVLWARNSSGYITNASDATGLKVVGMGAEEVDNSGGSNGDLDCTAELGIFCLVNSATNAVTRAHIGLPCYVEDNQTVASTGGSYGIVAGVVVDVDDDGVWVNVGVAPLEGIGRKRPVLVDADGATLTPALSGGVISNAGAAGAAVFALPPAVVGLDYTFVVEAAQELRIDPNGTETIALPSSGVQGAAGKYLTADAVGEKVHLVCLTAGTWDVEHYSGTWTAEA
jgi:hypothetical protein